MIGTDLIAVAPVSISGQRNPCNNFYFVKKGFNWYEKLFPQIGYETIVSINNPGDYPIHSNWRLIINL